MLTIRMSRNLEVKSVVKPPPVSMDTLPGVRNKVVLFLANYWASVVDNYGVSVLFL